MNLTLPANHRYLRISAVLLLLVVNNLFAQTKDPVSYVDPFIGTTKSSVLTKWGSEGGTYPGAVAPSGYMQLTPETRVMGAKGYDYSDSAIYYFSCLHHFSGFPSGSSGQLFIMPVNDGAAFNPATYRRQFSHRDEKALPGYYSVLFRDNNTLVEATATTRAGMFRFTFPPQVAPQLFMSDGERFNAALNFNEPYIDKQAVEGGSLLKFAPSTSGPKVILVSISASTVSKESAARNIAVELNAGFDQLKENTRQAWAKALSVIEITDSNEVHKTIFYTALYHSLLMPWIISDVDGHYRGADGQLHTVSGRKEYGGFSPWDTFRSLHPLLCLLFPSLQKEMVLSMLDVFQQTGHLPVESMTGNHAVPIIVDSWLKGITAGIDSTLAYTAMKKSITDTPFLQPDLEIYQQQGYIPFSYPESVTRTVEYAYDDWALAQFAGPVMQQEEDYRRLLRRSYHYRNLFHPEDMFLLPRQGNEVKLQPGTSGYKEGDPWVYSYFVPQHEQDLVNLMGGKELFTERLDAALTQRQIIFDNETVFHIPWLFNAADDPHRTQQWIGEILNTRFKATPGGLPGNDDLGSMSSWFILSAMGIYPACPGRPVYTIGAPLFRSLRIHLQNGKQFEIKRTQPYPYIRSLAVDHAPYNNIEIPHTWIMKGGVMAFETAAAPSYTWPVHKGKDTMHAAGSPDFHLLHYSLSKEKVEPHELFWVRFSLKNNGSMGTKQVQLLVNGQVYDHQNCLADSGVTVTDSIPCRLYEMGNARIAVNGLKELELTVIKPDHPFPDQPEIKDLTLQSLIKKGGAQQIAFTAQNTGGATRTFSIPVTLNGTVISREKITLQPGEQKKISRQFNVSQKGWQTLEVYKAREKFKVYATNKEMLLLDLQLHKNAADSIIADQSGFGNNATIIRSNQDSSLLLGKDCFVEVPNARSLDVLEESITMMAWVYPTAGDKGLVDLFTKGDAHVLQVLNNKTLTFFAGGWGRGDCSATLPENWQDHWHHIAGVCDGNMLRIYIDGELKGAATLEEKVNLSVSNKWNIGRNEEFPSIRIFNGYMDKVKVFAAPLSEQEIKEVMER